MNRKQIDIHASIREVQRDLEATSISVGNMADATRRMSDSGDAVTVRQTIENTAGKTEVLMGNTDEPKRGNVDRENNIWPASGARLHVQGLSVDPLSFPFGEKAG